ncbi:MAG: DEAD/DEAH box helicase, partial [Myxococcales bacterium]|nr:DEAD/DEAH box helicase [Myxococcales bacterium]
HRVGGTPKGRLFPLSQDELVESLATVAALREGELDWLTVPEAPLDILAQQIVATLAGGEYDEGELFELCRRAWPYRHLSRERFDDVVKMLAEGYATKRGRRSAHVHRDAVHGRLRGRRGARLAAVMNGGAIPDNADYEVVLEPAGVRVGTLNEDFAIESMAGDIFQLGNMSYRILRVEPGRVRVEDAQGKPPSIPFWLGEAPARTDALSARVSSLREEIERALDRGTDRAQLVEHLVTRYGESTAVVRQVVDYLDAGRVALGHIPTQKRLVLERFFDEAGNTHIVLHAPFGARVNRAWGLALRKRFCRTFNFELQAAATEDAIILSLGPTHSFPLEDVWSFLHPGTVRAVLTQALLDSPMFETRWRWNATRALSVLRFQGGRKTPPPLLRMRADDLLTVVFPDQVACAENLTGEREIPAHPLVTETIRDCLTEAMDVAGLERILADIRAGAIEVVSRDLTEPSPFAAAILNARPYAFLDDAPLEERRTQAVASRRWLDAASARDLGSLDAAAIARVVREAWPDVRDADELHDALLVYGALGVREVEGHDLGGLCSVLLASERALRIRVGASGLWVAAERFGEWKAAAPHTLVVEAGAPRAEFASASHDRAEALRELVRGRL